MPRWSILGRRQRLDQSLVQHCADFSSGWRAVPRKRLDHRLDHDALREHLRSVGQLVSRSVVRAPHHSITPLHHNNVFTAARACCAIGTQQYRLYIIYDPCVSGWSICHRPVGEHDQRREMHGNTFLVAVRCGLMRFDAVRCGSMRFDAVRCGSMRFDAVRCDAVRCGG